MTAEAIAKALGGRRTGATWMARCPAHADRAPSLSISSGRDGKVLVRCHAGCDQREVIAALQDRGLWEATGRALGHFARKHPNRVPDEPDADALKRSAPALAIWQASQPAEGTLVGTYLRSRGLLLPASAALRFHTGLKHPSGGVWPAMVALVTTGSENLPLAVHRTFLASDGKTKAPVDRQKLMLGRCHMGAVKLAAVERGAWLVIGEGLETTLSVMQACSLPGWAALSAGGIQNIVLPRSANMILICADNDANGVGQGAAHAAAQRFLAEGRRVRIALPPATGCDFNDVLRGAGAPSETVDVAA